MIKGIETSAINRPDRAQTIIIINEQVCCCMVSPLSAQYVRNQPMNDPDPISALNYWLTKLLFTVWNISVPTVQLNGIYIILPCIWTNLPSRAGLT